jgi:hypothetical protein
LHSLSGKGAGVGRISIGATLGESPFHAVLTVVRGIALRKADHLSESDPYVEVKELTAVKYLL